MQCCNIDWQVVHYKELNTNSLYEILALRFAVFVIEQSCVYLDPDYLDQEAYHVLGYRSGELIAYSRILTPGSKYREASIGRVLIKKTARGMGFGKALLTQGIEFVEQHFELCDIRISAQYYLQAFYQHLGFKPISNVYNDAGIMHIDMLRGKARC